MVDSKLVTPEGRRFSVITFPTERSLSADPYICDTTATLLTLLWKTEHGAPEPGLEFAIADRVANDQQQFILIEVSDEELQSMPQDDAEAEE